eukprot:GHVS01100140.1.p1 GENE.GHVS01100140.1~~GHVS01100140.1.p1  ORF type:complete len:297 (+),score=10.10 GHVS01100140.1:119-892(+)
MLFIRDRYVASDNTPQWSHILQRLGDQRITDIACVVKLKNITNVLAAERNSRRVCVDKQGQGTHTVLFGLKQKLDLAEWKDHFVTQPVKGADYFQDRLVYETNIAVDVHHMRISEDYVNKHSGIWHLKPPNEIGTTELVSLDNNTDFKSLTGGSVRLGKELMFFDRYQVDPKERHRTKLVMVWVPRMQCQSDAFNLATHLKISGGVHVPLYLRSNAQKVVEATQDQAETEQGQEVLFATHSELMANNYVLHVNVLAF